MELGDDGRLWRLTLQHSPVGMTLVATDGRFLAINDALCSMLDYPADELNELTFQELTHPDDLETDLDQLDATLAGEQASYRIMKRYVREDGSLVWGDLSVALLRDDDGTPIHFISQIQDVTAERMAEERRGRLEAELARNARELAAVFDTVDVGIIVLDADGQYTYMNRRHRDFINLAYPDGHYGRAGQLGYSYDREGRALERSDMPAYLASQGEEFDAMPIWVGEDPLTRRALSVSSRSLTDDNGSFQGAVLAYTDVTDVMRALAVKDEFVGSVSHELRTPMTSILGHLEMLLDREDLPADALSSVEVVQRNAARLRLLVGDLLHVAAAGDGKLHPLRTPVDVAALIRESVDVAAPGGEQSQVVVETDLPETVIALLDRERLRQVIDNLVSNAIKYSEPGGRVCVRLRVGPSDLVITVEDSGIGMAAEDHHLIFSPFYRASEALHRMIPGTGLGLNIVESIVRAHGGEVCVESTLGQGATFTVTLPLMRPS